MKIVNNILLSEDIQRSFYIGDEWLYYKIYCGPKTADDLLINIIVPICEEFVSSNLIKKWFYVRYSDPSPHLRLRIHLKEVQALSRITIKIRNRLSEYLSSGLVSNMIIDTYKREIERYGNYMLISEDFFFFDSRNTTQIIRNSVNETNRFIYAFNWVRYFLNYCIPDQDDRVDFVNNMQAQFRKEFKVEKQINKELQAKYKKLVKKLALKKRPVDNLFNSVPESLKSIASQYNQAELSVGWQQLVSSYVHMSINRIFRSNQRRYELLIYDFIKKQNDTKIARYGEL